MCEVTKRKLRELKYKLLYYFDKNFMYIFLIFIITVILTLLFI